MELLTRKKISTVIIVLLAWYWQKHVYRGPVYSNAKDLTGKTVLITGKLSFSFNQAMHSSSCTCFSSYRHDLHSKTCLCL